MSTKPQKIEDQALDYLQKRLLPSFIKIARKPRVGSQNCYFCEKQIMKGEWRVKAICSHGGHYHNIRGTYVTGCHLIYLYSHLSCFLKALKIKLKEEGFSIGIHKRTLAQLRRERVLAVLMHISKKHANKTTV